MTVVPYAAFAVAIALLILANVYLRRARRLAAEATRVFGEATELYAAATRLAEESRQLGDPL